MTIKGDKPTLEDFASQAKSLLKATKADGNYVIAFSVKGGNELPESYKLVKQERVK